jgi:hypothetical protein
MTSAMSSAGDLFLVHRDRHARHLGVHDLGELAIGPGQDQVAHRQHAEQVPPLIDHVDIKHLLELFAEPAKLVDGLFDREALGQRRDLWRHDAAGGVRRVLLELADLRGFVRLHLIDDRIVHLVRQMLQHIDRVVGGHGRDNHRSLRSTHVLEHRRRHGRVHLGKNSARRIWVEIFRDARGSCRRHVLQHIGAIGGRDLLDPLGNLIGIRVRGLGLDGLVALGFVLVAALVAHAGESNVWRLVERMVGGAR